MGSRPYQPTGVILPQASSWRQTGAVALSPSSVAAEQRIERQRRREIQYRLILHQYSDEELPLPIGPTPPPSRRAGVSQEASRQRSPSRRGADHSRVRATPR